MRAWDSPVSTLNAEVTDTCRHAWLFMWVLEIRTQVLMLIPSHAPYLCLHPGSIPGIQLLGIMISEYLMLKDTALIFINSPYLQFSLSIVKSHLLFSFQHRYNHHRPILQLTPFLLVGHSLAPQGVVIKDKGSVQTTHTK